MRIDLVLIESRKAIAEKSVAFSFSLVFLFMFFCTNLLAQNMPYTQLYTSGNFVKTIDLTKPVGEVTGSAGATGSGGLSYNIPIFTSPGTNGLQPSISLSYNSQGSSGVAGFGWNISGLSAISRTGKNIYHNGIVQPVKFTAADDAFLLDGMRLNVISGTNGANGTIYAGEAETFAKIISFTINSADNPDWFQVIAKDGSIMEFGHSTDSRFLTDNGSSVMLWRLNKIIDINDNYIEFKYDNANRNSSIKQILYTGNTGTGLLPYNQVNFTYNVRSDQNTSYDAGASINSQYLLDKVTIIHTNDASVNETVKTYKLNYGFDNVHSLLKEIVEFGGDESSASFNSTIFLYGDPAGNLSTETTAQFNGECITGDFNADGKTDILASAYYNDNGIKYSSGYKILLNPQSATALYEKVLSPGHIIVENKKLANFLASDYNRDGRDDVLNVKTKIVTYPSGNTDWQVERFTIEFTTATGSTTQEMPMPPGKIINPSGNFFIPGDFDGDGNQDYITILASYNPSGYIGNYNGYICTPGTVFANYGIGQFTVTPGVDWSANSIASADKIIPFDLNGDGKQEVLVVKGTQSSILSINPNTGTTYTASIILTTTEIALGDKLFPGDFNGDRKSDLLIRKANGLWKILYSTGTGFSISTFTFNQPVLMNGNYSDDKIVVGDFNGDGKSDVAHGFPVWVNGTSNSSKFSLYYSKGLGTSPFFYEQYTYNNVLPFVDLATGDFNGDGRSDILSKNYYYGAPDIIYFKPNSQERLLQKITTGHNVTTTFTHKLMTDKNTFPYVYDRTVSLSDPINQNPINYIQLPMYVLASSSAPDGAGGNNITEYKYENAVLHRAAKGFLGFKKITAKNNISGFTVVSENEINTQFAIPYQVKQTSSLTSTGALLSESIITNSFVDLSTGYSDKRYLHKIDKTLSIDYLNDKASESVNTYDSYSNIIANVSKTGYMSGANITATETANTSTSFSIHNTPVPAKPDNITVTNTRTGQPAISATSSFTYTANGLPLTQKSFDGLPKAVTTTYGYNSFGNVVSTTTGSTGLGNRVTNIIYDSKGRYAAQKQIGVGTSISQTETYTVDGKWGSPLSITTSDCLTSINIYDGFGKLTQSTLPDGNTITYTDTWIVNANSLFYSKTHFAGGKPDVKVYYDKFGREYKSEKASLYKLLEFDDFPDLHTILTTYDNRNNVKTKTNSYFPFKETARITTNNYDEYNRPVNSVNYIGTTTIAYSNLGSGNKQITATTPAGLISSKTMDATGKTISSSDNGGQLNFSYDSRGNQTQVNHGNITVVNAVYDSYGRQVSLVDKNAGTTTYAYDGYAQLTNQTDAKSNSYTLAYDELGRVLTRTGTEGVTSYEYYKDIATGCSNNNPVRVTGFNGVINEYSYDALKRLSSQKQTIDGVPYTTSYAYSSFSQLVQTTYPSNTSIYNRYDVNGYLTAVSESKFKLINFFASGEVDGEGRYKTYTLYNNAVTNNSYNNDFPATTSTPGIQNLSYNFQPSTGNLLQRTDQIKNQSETFSYDNLNRLISSTVNGQPQFGITYDGTTGNSLGNITTKTDAGYYTYKTDKIHAVAFTMNSPGPSQSAVSPTPASAIPHSLQQITYTPFLKTASITENGLSLGFDYGPDYERVKTVYTNGPAVMETRYFIGNYEKQVKPGSTKEIIYINGGDGLCAMIVTENGVSQTYAVYKDHLGSIVTLTDRHANIVAEQNFDAWGRRREPNNWAVYIPPSGGGGTVPDWLYRGYTGHEMLTQFSLINMNGRMYDPILGRMISPDNYVPTPYGTQGYNRYSYAMNNPLSYVDPDGNLPIILIAAIIGGVINLGAKAYQGKINNFGDGLKAFGVGAAAGAVGAWAGGAALGAAGLSGASVAGGAVAGVAGGMASSPILGFGNNLFFDDPYSLKSFGRDVLIGGVGGAVVGGVLGGLKGNNIWLGKPPAEGRNIWSFNNRPIRNNVGFLRGSVYVEPPQYAGWDNADGSFTGEFAGHKINTNPGGLNTRFVTTQEGVTIDLQGTINRIQTGGSFPHRNDGSIFKNFPPRGQTTPLLPSQPQGYYHEFVHPIPGFSGPGPMRIVTGLGGEMWFTPNHYNSFMRIR